MPAELVLLDEAVENAIQEFQGSARNSFQEFMRTFSKSLKDYEPKEAQGLRINLS